MKLTDHEKAMLNGADGEVVAEAMDNIVQFGMNFQWAELRLMWTDIQPEVWYDADANEIVFPDGDVWARMNVRMDEVEESIKIIEYALDHMPSGPIRVDVPRSIPVGEAVLSLEAPRGELFYYVRSNGTDMPDRVKIRTPTFANIPSFLKTAIGESIADVPSNFVSLDPCFSCTDR